jgi:DNA-binding transcriptional MerR regulator
MRARTIWIMGARGSIRYVDRMVEERSLCLAELAHALGVDVASVRRLVRAGLLQPTSGAGRRRMIRESDYPLARLLVDLADAGFSLAQLRALTAAARAPATAAEASRAIVDVIDRALPTITSRLERLRRVREDLIRASTTLYRCRACYKPVAELGCRDCDAMKATPRVLDAFFLATGDPKKLP